jgi:hypothetical protein
MNCDSIIRLLDLKSRPRPEEPTSDRFFPVFKDADQRVDGTDPSGVVVNGSNCPRLRSLPPRLNPDHNSFFHGWIVEFDQQASTFGSADPNREHHHPIGSTVGASGSPIIPSGVVDHPRFDKAVGSQFNESIRNGVIGSPPGHRFQSLNFKKDGLQWNMWDYSGALAGV